MSIEVREMELSETVSIVDYFHDSTPEHLDLLGVDPTRLPARAGWLDYYTRQFSCPYEKRSMLALTWLADGRQVGFSTADKIAYGEEAHMHLHILDPGRRGAGFGTECVRQSARLYFDLLRLKRLFCEPNAYNVAPNRTLQKAGFRYVKTHRTVPGPLNYHQPVTRWVMERAPAAGV